MTMFLITDDGAARLKSYDATTKGKISTLRVTVEVSDAYELAHMLESLERIAQAQASRARAAKAPKPATTTHKSVGHQKLLALPPPERDE